jgi:hypothetical protein
MDVKTVVKTSWTWINDRPINFVIFGAACWAVAVFWQPLLTAAFWYTVTPGSFVLTYGAYRWWKNRQAKV